MIVETAVSVKRTLTASPLSVAFGGGGRSGRPVLTAGAAILLVIVCAGDRLLADPAPTAGRSSGRVSSPLEAGPAAERPPAPVSGSQWQALRLGPRDLVQDGTAGSFDRITLSVRPAFRESMEPGQRDPDRFSTRLLSRMTREARKKRRGNLEYLAPVPGPIEDSSVERLRAHHAERIITRSFDHAFDEQLEDIARMTPGLRKAFAWVENLGRSSDRIGSGGRPAEPQGTASAPTRAPRFSASVKLKVAAHPRIILRSEFWKFRGSIDVPVRNEPIRVRIERDLGLRSSVTLSSGFSRSDGDHYAQLSFKVGF